MAKGTLTVVGTGIKLVAHATFEARQCIERADTVPYVVADAAVEAWIRGLNPNARSLNGLYGADKPRLDTYEEMVEAILEPVRRGLRVCAVFYGHPGVFVYPSHRAIARAKEQGYPARMAPGVSAEDCLFAALGVDPGAGGCQSYEATNFLVRARRFDPHAPLILWQVGVIGDFSVRDPATFNEAGIRVLVDVLSRHYPVEHEVVLYQAAEWTLVDDAIQRVPLRRLAGAAITPLTTLYVPPLPGVAVDAELVARLGLGAEMRALLKARGWRE